MLKKIAGFFAVAMLSIMLMACGQKADKVETPADNSLERGRNYKEVIEDFEDKGFTNIKTDTIADLVYGRSFRDGEVERISVGGDINYDSGVWVPADTEVVITYHTFSQKSIEEVNKKEEAKKAAEEAEQKEEADKAADDADQMDSDQKGAEEDAAGNAVENAAENAEDAADDAADDTDEDSAQEP